MTKKKDDVASRIARAREAGFRLVIATEKLNLELTDAEEVLAGIGMGVATEVDITDEDEHGTTPPLETAAGFWKHDGKWQLLFLQRTADPNQPETDAWTKVVPVHKASRESRLRVARALPRLVDALIVETERQAAEIEATAESTSALVNALRERS